MYKNLKFKLYGKLPTYYWLTCNMVLNKMYEDNSLI